MLFKITVTAILFAYLNQLYLLRRLRQSDGGEEAEISVKESPRLLLNPAAPASASHDAPVPAATRVQAKRSNRSEGYLDSRFSILDSREY